MSQKYVRNAWRLRLSCETPGVPPRDEEPRNSDLVVFGRIVRTSRIYAGMSQARFGTVVGIDQGSMSRLERGALPGIRLRRLLPLLKEMGFIRPPR